MSGFPGPTARVSASFETIAYGEIAVATSSVTVTVAADIFKIFRITISSITGASTNAFFQLPNFDTRLVWDNSSIAYVSTVVQASREEGITAGRLMGGVAMGANNEHSGVTYVAKPSSALPGADLGYGGGNDSINPELIRDGVGAWRNTTDSIETLWVIGNFDLEIGSTVLIEGLRK